MSTIQRNPVMTLGALSLMVVGMASCGGDPNSPGVEYMPDMYRSPAVEAYVDYGQDPYYFTEDKARAQRERPSAMLPPAGTRYFPLNSERMRNTPSSTLSCSCTLLVSAVFWTLYQLVSLLR